MFKKSLGRFEAFGLIYAVAHGNRWGYLRLGIQGSLQRGASSRSLEMNPAPIQIVSRHRFEDMFLKSSHHWVISIREADEIGIPRPDFINPRVNLAFWDQITVRVSLRLKMLNRCTSLAWNG